VAAAPAGTKVAEGSEEGGSVADEAAAGGASVMAGSEAGDQSYAYSMEAPSKIDDSTATGAAAGAVGGAAAAGAVSSAASSGDEMSSHAMSSLRQNMVSRTVVAPPGKLGIVIDTTLEGPVVHKVNPQSPLEGSLFPGDIIVAIDDVDTRAMSASAITALMVRTANQRRKLTVLSEDITN
jgi:C-terminal processing protease CtpA/Prc